MLKLNLIHSRVHPLSKFVLTGMNSLRFFLHLKCISKNVTFIVKKYTKAGLKAEGITPRPLGRNLGPGLALGFIPVIKLH